MNNNNQGYIALSSVLVLLVMVVMIGTTVALNAISDAQLSLSEKTGAIDTGIAESCIEESLLQINESDSINSTITIPEGTCSVVVNTHTGNDWTFTVTVQGNNQKQIKVSANRGTTVTITDWIEI